MNIRYSMKKITLVTMAIFLSVTSVSSTTAQALDETFYSGNDILYYDPGGTCTATATGSGGCGSEFNIATYNILYSTAPGGSDWKSRLHRTADVIKNKEGGIDVVGLQEVREDQWRALQTEEYLGDAYGIYPKPYGNGAYPGQNPIVWKKDRFDLVEGTALPGYTVKAQRSETASVQVKLRDKLSGQEFYVINGHHPAGNGFDRQRTKMVKDLYAHAKSLNSPSTPVFMTADFNTKLTPRDQGAGTKREDLAYCVLTQDPFWHVYDARDNKTGPCPSRQFSLDGGRAPEPVDHIFMSDTVSASKVSRVPSGKSSNGSDVHDTIVARVKITGSCDTSSGSGVPISATLAHANVVTQSKRPNQQGRFEGTMRMFAPHNPDFVTLNEIAPGTNTNYNNYKSFKQDHPNAKTSEDSAVRIVWNADKWKKIDGGIEQIHPFETLAGKSSRKDRYALWATFQNINSGGAISVIATHWNTGATFHPNHGRAKLQGENIAALAQRLMPHGPVLVGGDLNYRISDQYLNKPYSPDTTLGKAGLKAVFKPADASNVDWILHTEQLKNTQKKVFTATGHLTDHPYLVASFEGMSSGTVGTPNSTNCTCIDPEADSGDNLAAPGGSNVSKNFSLGSENGKRPVNLLKQLMTDFNFKDYQAAGIVGNFMHESGGAHLPPNVNEGGDAGPPKFSGGYGWAQWTGGRQTAFIDFAVANGFMASRNVSATDAANYAYLVHELTATAEKGAVPAVKATSNVSEAAAKFEEVFERAGVVANESRDNHARDVLNAYKNNSGIDAPGTSSGTNTAGSCPESNGATGESPEFGEVAFPLKGRKSVVKNPESAFAPSTHPYKANDIYASAGTEVLAYASGTVTSLHDGDLGKGVSVYNEKAKLVVYYTHMASVSVREGDTISPGDKLGALASVRNYPGINVDHLHIDASTDRVRQACSRSSCSILDHFRSIGPNLQELYNKLPE